MTTPTTSSVNDPMISMSKLETQTSNVVPSTGQRISAPGDCDERDRVTVCASLRCWIRNAFCLENGMTSCAAGWQMPQHQCVGHQRRASSNHGFGIWQPAAFVGKRRESSTSILGRRLRLLDWLKELATSTKIYNWYVSASWSIDSRSSNSPDPVLYSAPEFRRGLEWTNSCTTPVRLVKLHSLPNNMMGVPAFEWRTGCSSR